MSTSSPPRSPADGLVPVAWSDRASPWMRIGAVVVALLVVVVVWQVVREEVGPGLAGRASVTASSVSLGGTPHAVVESGSVQEPGVGWRSDRETVGAWIELGWTGRHELRQIVLVRNEVTEPGVTQGFLSFGDGSQLQVVLSATARDTVVPFVPRSVDRVRFTASAVDRDAQDVRISEIIVSAVGDGTAAGDAIGQGEVPDGGLAALGVTTGTGGGDPTALTEGAAGAGWSASDPVGAWAQVDWAQAEEVASVEVVGAPSEATLRSATLTFGDGSTLAVGAVLPDPGRPTVIGFMPRVTRSLRLTIDSVTGAGPLTLGELRVHRRGTTPVRTPTPGSPTTPTADAACVNAGSGPPAGTFTVQCPVAGSAVGGPFELKVAAPGFSTVTATVWPADEAAGALPPVSRPPGSSGVAVLPVDVSVLPPGPVTVHVEASGGDEEPASAFLPLHRTETGGDPPREPATSITAAGRTLVYAEEFNGPISISRAGADTDYTAAKPVHDGVEDFGEAIFADPAQGFGNIEVLDDRYLRIDVEPLASGFTDPQKWGRTHLGGLLSSARPGGSGFSAQYGYFEARMLLPGASGTWSAFWMLPNDNLVEPTPVVAEIDALEHYGHNPTGACHASRSHNSTQDPPGVRCGERFPDDRSAFAWHTFGVSVTPTDITYFIDDRPVVTTRQVEGGGAPMFFMVNLALGGGWPLELDATGGRVSLYVDYVRVYV